MRRRGPEYTFEPYDRVPDNETVRGPHLVGWRRRAWQIAFIACCVLVPTLIVLGALKS